MFTGNGLARLGEARWQRALLTIGDYLLYTNGNYSFLANPATESASWKQLLRGSGQGVAERRPYLKKLWDSLTNAQPFPEQLDEIIHGAEILEPWIRALVETPDVFEYCKKNFIRWRSENEVYLLPGVQRRRHAELFTYCLFCNPNLWKFEEEGRFRPLEEFSYKEAFRADEKASIQFIFPYRKLKIPFRVEYHSGQFKILVDRSALEAFPEIHTLLCGSGGFVESEHVLSKKCTPETIMDSWIELAGLLSTLPD